jgi:hypothetical protein
MRPGAAIPWFSDRALLVVGFIVATQVVFLRF